MDSSSNIIQSTQKSILGAIIQARMTSTRLPGKILMPVYKSISMLEMVIMRIHSCPKIDILIIATTINNTDDPVVQLCYDLQPKYPKLRVFRGSENNVLSRFYFAAHKYHLDHIIRITSDCPLIQPDILNQMIQEYYNDNSDYDYLSNTLIRTFPRGLDAEIFKTSALDRAYLDPNATNAEIEHVTPYINSQPSHFRLHNWSQTPDYSNYRLTVDTQEDLDLIKLIYATLYPRNPLFTQNDIINILEENPDWLKINAEIEQKTYCNRGIIKA
jgi:spore coat polysaccharide biosynthesis protein SpsF